MNNLTIMNDPHDLKGTNFLTSGILNAIPLALASPVLEYQKTKIQAQLIESAIESKCIERTKILETMQTLAEHGQLTPEITQYLMVAYHQPPY